MTTCGPSLLRELLAKLTWFVPHLPWESTFVEEQEGFFSGSAVKNPPAVQETQGMWLQSLGWEDPLEEGMVTHSSVLAWRIPMDRRTWQATVQRISRVGHD